MFRQFHLAQHLGHRTDVGGGESGAGGNESCACCAGDHGGRGGVSEAGGSNVLETSKPQATRRLGAHGATENSTTGNEPMEPWDWALQDRRTSQSRTSMLSEDMAAFTNMLNIESQKEREEALAIDMQEREETLAVHMQAIFEQELTEALTSPEPRLSHDMLDMITGRRARSVPAPGRRTLNGLPEPLSIHSCV